MGRDIAYTLASFCVLAISGITINLVLAGFRDASSLGIFNQVYALYIVTSQFAALGIHYSVLRHTPVASDSNERSLLLSNALYSTIMSGVVTALIMYIFASQIGHFFESEPVGVSVKFAAIGLVIFPPTRFCSHF